MLKIHRPRGIYCRFRRDGSFSFESTLFGNSSIVVFGASRARREDTHASWLLFTEITVKFLNFRTQETLL